MRLLLAVSADGHFAKGPDDDMSWTGADDKALFRALTSVGGLCCIGRRSAAHTPSKMIGRELKVLSTADGHWRLHEASAARDYSGGRAWLLGGPTLAMKALEENRLSEIHLCVSVGHIFPSAQTVASVGYLDEGRQVIPAQPLLAAMHCRGFRLRMSTNFGTVRHTLYTTMDRSACLSYRGT